MSISTEDFKDLVLDKELPQGNEDAPAMPAWGSPTSPYGINYKTRRRLADFSGRCKGCGRYLSDFAAD